jgi:O-acetyl-ADP-ribose deacetylase (regulator of RNase III)
MSISYIKGDATNPAGQGNKIIVHICNDIGGWGKGFVMAISKRWKEPERKYREWFKQSTLTERNIPVTVYDF